MRALWVMVCLLWSVMGCCADNLRLVVDAKSPQFTVSLPANPTTGFQWAVASYDTARFHLVSSRYKTTATKRIGAGGTQVFVFERKKGATNRSCTRMTYRYARSWEPHSGHLTHVTIVFKDLTKARVQKNH